MKAVIGALRVNLGLDSAEFQKGLAQANGRMNAWAKGLAAGMAGAIAAVEAGLTALTVRSMNVIDDQSKLARQLDTTVASLQVVTTAGDLAGVSFDGIAKGGRKLTLELGKAAAGAGPAHVALQRLKLSAGELSAMPLDRRIVTINTALAQHVPVAERAAVAAKLFGREGAFAITQLDSAAIRSAARDVRDFGIAVSDVDAARIEEANDAISRIGLALTGMGNQMAVAVAPFVERVANGFANMLRQGQPLQQFILGVSGQIGRFTAYAAAAAGVMGARWVGGFVAARVATFSLVGAMTVLRGAILRTGIGIIIVGAGELVYQFTRLVDGAGGFANALGLLKDVAVEVWDRIKRGAFLMAEEISLVGARIQGVFANVWASIAEGFAGLTGFIADGWNGLFGTNMKGMGTEFAAGLRAEANYLKDVNTGLRESMNASWSDVAGPLKSIQAIRDAMAGSGATASDLGDTMAATGAAAREMGEDFDAAAGKDGGGGSKGGGRGAGKLKKKLDDISEASKAAGSAFNDMAKSFITGSESAGEAIHNLAGKLLDTLLDQALSPLADAFGNMFGGFMKNLGGGAKLTAKIPAYANGTNFHPGGLAMVGERGPELVNLRRGAQVIPNEYLGGGGMVVNQSFTVNAGAGSDPSAIVAALRPAMQQAAQQVLARARREGR